jgi:NhaP-type Na+/H+ or K+/H+ antiporter
MADPALSLLVGATILLVGFGAYLIFRRFHIPDFLVLIILGGILFEIPVAPFGPNLLGSLGSVLPLFLQLTIAFILFEGGLSLKIRQVGRALGPLMAHIVGAFLLTFGLIWFLASRVFGLSEVSSLVLATALANPSASIALSFAPRMRLSERAEAGIVLEGVITNVFAVMGILYIVQWAGGSSQLTLVTYGLETALASGIAVVAALGWRAATRALRSKEFTFIASLAVAIIVYATAQLFLVQNGAIAVFLFGLVLGYHRPATIGEDIDEFVGEFTRPVENLRSFQAELTFALRTFFFLYLGLLLVSEWAGLSTMWYGALLALAFVLGRAPTSLGIGRALHFPARERRALLASMGRGLTDVILILLVVQTGILPSADSGFMLSVLPTAVLLSAFVCAGLLTWAGHAPISAEVVSGPHPPAPADPGVKARPGPSPPPEAGVPKPADVPRRFTGSTREAVSRRAPPPGPSP